MLYCFIVTAAWLVWHIGFRIRVIGRENLPKEGGFVLAPNHISAIDPVFVVVARFWGKRLLIMAKEEILQVNPVFTWMFRHVGVVGIERGRGDVNVVDELIGDVQKGQGLLIFPEGTRTKTGKLSVLKSGAFVIAGAAGADMVPCRIIYGSKDGKMHLFCKIRIVFGEPIPAAELQVTDTTHKIAALRRMKNRLRDDLEQLLAENAFPALPAAEEKPAIEPHAAAQPAAEEKPAIEQPAAPEEPAAVQPVPEQPAAPEQQETTALPEREEKL